MQYSQQIIVKRWIPILKEYERTKAKITPRPFKFVKNLCDALKECFTQPTLDDRERAISEADFAASPSIAFSPSFWTSK
jgi:hypothetical protein